VNIPRSVRPEWLDQLPPGNPRALRSRQDLRRINALMMNGTLVARELLRAHPGVPPLTIAEIGAGDGTFMLRIADKLPPRWGGVEVVLLDRQSLVSRATRARFVTKGWRAQAVQADVFNWLSQPDAPVFDVIVANLFLHHFEPAGLAELLSLVARRTRVLIACEPRRSAPALLGSHLLGLLGCNDVSRHDAVVSVHAGFKGRDLSKSWTAAGAWCLREHARGLFSHCFVAARADGNVPACLGRGA
jgi:hypothetical protein